MPFLTRRETTDLSMRKALLNSVIPTDNATMSNYATLRKATSDWQTALAESVGRVPIHIAIHKWSCGNSIVSDFCKFFFASKGRRLA